MLARTLRSIVVAEKKKQKNEISFPAQHRNQGCKVLLQLLFSRQISKEQNFKVGSKITGDPKLRLNTLNINSAITSNFKYYTENANVLSERGGQIK